MANYLYNGVELPALPEWDTETYPYAVIGLYGGTQYWLFCANYAWTALQLSGTTQIQKNQDVDTIAWIWCRLDTATGKWTTFVQGDSTTAYYYALSEVVWTNADMVLYTYAEDGETRVTDGTLYLAASDPIPVGKPITDPLSFTMGYNWMKAMLAKRAGRKPIGYSYNGVQLPKIPEVEGYDYKVVVHVMLGAYRVYFCENAPVAISATQFKIDAPAIAYYCGSSESQWERNESQDITSGTYTGYIENSESTIGLLEWSNVNIADENGVVYFEASEPVPVYE